MFDLLVFSIVSLWVCFYSCWSLFAHFLSFNNPNKKSFPLPPYCHPSTYTRGILGCYWANVLLCKDPDLTCFSLCSCGLLPQRKPKLLCLLLSLSLLDPQLKLQVVSVPCLLWDQTVYYPTFLWSYTSLFELLMCRKTWVSPLHVVIKQCHRVV